MSVHVDDCRLAKSGKCYNVTLSGQKYLANLDSGLNANIGKWVEAEIQPSKDPKFPSWIGKWVHAASPDAAPGASSPAGGSPASLPPVAAPVTREPVYATQNANVAPWWMPFVSNTVAHAIQAGHCQSPEGIRTWAIAARNAANSCVATTPLTTDEDIPF